MKATLIVIENEKDHAAAKALVAKWMVSGNPANSGRMAAQARLIEAYERARRPRRAPSPPDPMTYLMDQHGLARADLASLPGGASRVSEVMNGRRELSMAMVKRLRERFDISADVLIQSTRRRLAAQNGNVISPEVTDAWTGAA
jgi:HTH-type transcriptional regulator/antitoxin HigA